MAKEVSDGRTDDRPVRPDLHAPRRRRRDKPRWRRRVSKTDARVEVSGAVDELNAAVGVVLAADVPAAIRTVLERVQNELFDLGADLAVPLQNEKRRRLRVGRDHVEWLERACDEHNETLPALKSFVLPGGNEVSARLHLARAICRRAERRVVALADLSPINYTALAYLNRLSDLLFILARGAAAGEEKLWSPGVTLAR